MTNTTHIHQPDHPTHRFFESFDYEVRCDGCDCRPGGRWAPLPCGKYDEGDVFEAGNGDREAGFRHLAAIEQQQDSPEAIAAGLLVPTPEHGGF